MWQKKLYREQAKTKEEVRKDAAVSAFRGSGLKGHQESVRIFTRKLMQREHAPILGNV